MRISKLSAWAVNSKLSSRSAHPRISTRLTASLHSEGHTAWDTPAFRRRVVVDLSHSQPFWAHNYPDLAIVHNGHITNYHKLRCIYEQRGVRFYTENDSEVIGVYLANQLSQGLEFKEALDASLTDLDGSFSYLRGNGGLYRICQRSLRLQTATLYRNG